ncbi:MAG: PAS domain S-box protein [Desulfurivibrio sp.]|jgi:two-component system sensor histidine kinase PilS (NtrC family)|nr:MAG: PAS domain S-box protein [Desulfurivibrio sp.]
MIFDKICPASRAASSVDYYLKNQILWILFLRVVVLTILLGITILLQTKEHEIIIPPVRYIAYFTVGTYLFTIFSAFFLRVITCYRSFAYLQIITDCLLTSCLVFFTGGSQSIFTIIYFFPIISSAILLFRRGALLLAALTTFSYAAILGAEFLLPDLALLRLGITPLNSIHVAMHYFSIRGLTFFLVAALSFILSERLHRAEAELSKTSQDLDRLALLYKQIFDDIATGIITVDSQGRISSFNRSAGIITGYAAIDVLGRKIDQAFPELSISTDSIRPMTYLQKKRGEKIPVGYSWTRLNMPGDSENARVYTMQDLSVIKKMEEKVRQAEKMAAIGEMAAGIAHEFRNPLAAISGAAQVLENDFEPATSSRSLMNIIIRECDRLEETISQFLEFSKPATPEKSWLSIAGIVQESCDLLTRGRNWDQRFAVKTIIPENLDCWADARQVKQVILNLMENARNAMEQTGGAITISASEISEDGQEKTLLQVADNGPGIAEKFMDQIFEPFFTTRENGTGLGLAIVRQLVDSHGGQVWLENKKEGGAVFSFTLPLP